jgi:arylsulfatase A-like enzyme
VVLVVIDTLRADEAAAADLPTLRALERQGLSYRRAYATASFTTQSLPGLLAGRMPSAYEYRFVTHNDATPLDVRDTLLTEVSAAGFDVGIAGGIVPSQSLGIFGDHGFGRGARVLEHGFMDTPADETTHMALRVWRSLDASRRRFLYVHYMALHHGHSSREEYRSKLRVIDAELGRLRSEIPDALWVVTADHGESFGLHGRLGHSTTLFAEVLHVPLLLSWPGGPRGSIDTVTSLRAIPPTLLAMTSTVHDGIEARGRGPYLCVVQGSCQDMVALSALEKPSLHLHSAILGDYQVLRDVRLDRTTVYDLRRDPDEQHPIEPAPPELSRTLQAWEQRLFSPSDAVIWPYRH